MKLELGILIVGSLYWDKKPSRVSWRKCRLNFDKKYSVRVPIRYGRQSVCRGNTYTIVFSQLCLRKSHGLGTAKAVACKRDALSIDDIIMEAEFLWSAECSRCMANDNISADWGCVALLQNPNVKIPSYLTKGWKSRVLKESTKLKKSKYGKLRHSKSETSIVNDKGILQIPWPNTVNGENLRFDLLLATATNPAPKRTPFRYTRIREIAHAWKQDKQGNDEYFWENRKHSIRTYQDELIIQHMQ